MKHLLLFAALVVLGALLAAAGVYWTIPLSNTHRNHFDVLVVLGGPTSFDGSPSPEQRARVGEAVREYRAHVAPAIIMTGGPAHNSFVEAEVMARYAESLGVPAERVLQEKQALNTIQNAWYSWQIMKAHGWNSAEIVSAPSHLPRASLIFMRYPIQWRAHAAPIPIEYPLIYKLGIYGFEIFHTDQIRLFGFKSTQYFPQPSR